jgi:MoxR-like ATPase
LYRNLLAHAFPKEAPSAELRARRSIVLIDEIDKASRDFPNDLLNAIERLEFRIRELREFAWSPIRVSDDDAYRPIVIITSNGEREIPAPFLRRCVFCHIPDPDPELLRRIVRNRVLGAPPSGRRETGPTGSALLPKLYEDLLGVFLEFRGDAQSFAYRPGTSELVDWSRAIHRRRADPDSHRKDGRNPAIVRETASAVAKNDKDRSRLIQLLSLVPDANEPST